jgi:CheY-like chemotaxis protein
MLDLTEMIDHMHKMLVRLIGEDINIYTMAKAVNPMIMADPGNIEQIIVNLAINSRDAMSGGGSLTIETENIFLDENYCRNHVYSIPGDYVMLSINDTGTGISEEVKKHLFEPFFTTKPKGKGTGLGLSMVYGAVKQNQGTIEVYSVPGQGTSIKIYFPCRAGKMAADPEGRTNEVFPGSGETILLVEDNPMVLDFAFNIMERMGYKVLKAESGEIAIELEESYKDRIDLLITDVVLPGINGKLLAEELNRRRPELKVLFTSGYTENFIESHGGLHKGINFLGKPYSANALSRKIRKVIDKGQGKSR